MEFQIRTIAFGLVGSRLTNYQHVDRTITNNSLAITKIIKRYPPAWHSGKFNFIWEMTRD